MFFPANFPEISNLIELTQWQAKHNPEKIGITFLPDGEDQEINLTFRELDEQARVVSAWLQTQARVGERALLLFPPGINYIVTLYGCLYAGIVAVIVNPPLPNMPLAPLEEVADHAQATLAITISPVLNTLTNQLSRSRLGLLRWLTQDQIPEHIQPIDWKNPDLPQTTIALLVYTSGSTSFPKGVMISHSNLISEMIPTSERLRLNEDSVYVSWFPLHHMAGLFWVYLLIGIGLRIILMPVWAFIDRPVRWLRAITRYGGTCTGAFNFGLQSSIERIPMEERITLDLSRLQTCFLEGERIRADLVEQFVTAFEPYGINRSTIVPIYALTETVGFGTVVNAPAGISTYTLDRAALGQNWAVQVPPGTKNSQTYVSCGRPLGNKRIIIVDPETHRQCPPEYIGEIWISGPSIAAGYWNNPLETSKNFRASLADTGEGPFLRTGDLGFEDDGQIIITGRIKDMIILHGKNFYSQDFEKTVDGCHPALARGGVAAFAVTHDDGEERLSIVCELKPDHNALEVESVFHAVRQAIGKDQQQSVHLIALVKAGAIPRTPSGKLKRYLCRDELTSGRLNAIAISRLEDFKPTTGQTKEEYIAPKTPIERALVGIWSSVLGLKGIGVNDNFFDLGGDSLKATLVLAQAQDIFQIELPSRLQFDTFTVGGLAEFIANLRGKPGETKQIGKES